MDFDKKWFDTEGPLGLPMKEEQAKTLEAVLQALPTELRTPKRLVIEKAPTETLDGERSDISWISTETPDRDREVVVAKGMDDSHFALNPIVTYHHHYWEPPVGMSVWRKRSRQEGLIGIKAKTAYPVRPNGWKEDMEWPADCAFTLVQAGLMRGKSIGFLPLQTHIPTEDEKKQPGWEDVRRVIDRWLLLEYACCFLPAQQHAVVEAVNKAGPIPKHWQEEIERFFQLDQHKETLPPGSPPAVLPFTSLKEIEQSVARRVEAFDFTALAKKAVEDGYARATGKV